jgi:hypothetical protein
LSACLLSCTRVAASRMQIVPEWQPVACKLYLRGRRSHANFGRFHSRCMLLAATRVQFACDWRPLGHNLHAIGGHSSTIYMRLAANRMQTLHALEASCLQSRQLFDLKNEEAIKKSENLRHTCACKGLSINTMHCPIQSRETVPLKGHMAKK